MRKPTNFKAAWNRNVNPALRTASFVGLYSRENGVPVRFAARIWFPSVREAELWADRSLPKLVNGRVSSFYVAGDMTRNEPGHTLGQYRVEFEMSGRRGVVPTMPRIRYQRFRDAVLASGFNIDWQGDIGLPRAYRTRDAFETALEGPPVRPDPRIPD